MTPEATMREKAVTLAKKDPVKAAQLIRAWIASDVEAAKEARRG
jgi:flagellar biosynthesis/type III secretory pathway M-ring protein FliF/YscJ